MNDMTGIDRDALARIIREAMWLGTSPREIADAVLAHLAATDRPTDTGLREERLVALIAEGMGVPAGPSVWATARMILAAPDPGPDQADGGTA